jgi:ankyrin repeat protein
MAHAKAAVGRVVTLAQAGQADELKRLLVEPLSFTCKRYAVRLAAANGHVDCVHILVRYVTDFTSRSWFQRLALFTAAGHGEAECVRALCAAKADVKAASCAPQHAPTALATAARHGCTDTVRALLEAKASMEPFTLVGHAPAIAYAAERGNDDVVLLLLEAGSPLPPLSKLVRSCSMPTLQILLHARANVNLPEYVGEGLRTTPLFAAASCGRADVVRALCAAHADVDDRYWHNETALGIAERRGHADVVRALCDAKADPGP